MAPRFGIILPNAEIVDQETRGGVLIIKILATGLTKNACKRGARKEASSLIPAINQNFINEAKESSKGVGQRWLFTVSDNGD